MAVGLPRPEVVEAVAVIAPHTNPRCPILLDQLAFQVRRVVTPIELRVVDKSRKRIHRLMITKIAA